MRTPSRQTPFKRSAIGQAVAGLALLLGTAPLLAAGFLINESSGSGLGNAFAGGAAVAEDASTLWSNVAGMSRIRDRQGVGAIHLITPSMKFSDQASAAAASQALGGSGGDAGGLNVVPNLYFVAPVAQGWSVGLGVSAPWGLVTEYETDWIGRFQGVKSSIKTINFNPGVAWKPARSVGLGFGLNVQRMDAEFTNQVNYSAALLGAAAKGGITPGSDTFNAIAQATAGLESGARIEGSDTAWGWNAGLLWEIDANGRFGAHYRSRIKYDLGGSATFSNPTPVVPPSLATVVGGLAAAVNSQVLYNSGIRSEVELPEIINLSYFRTLDSRWDVMLDAQWTGWSTIETLTFVRSDGTPLQSTPENFEDAWKVSLGANYRYDDKIMFRGGVAYDQSPVQTAYRTPRLPDADRTWLAGGVQYKMSPQLTFDLGAAYVWVKDAEISQSGHPPSIPAYGLLDGRYNNGNTVIVSGQLIYSF